MGRRILGLLLLVVAVYTLGAWQARNWGDQPATAPPSIQAPAPGWDYQRPLCAELASHPDEVARRRACE